MSALLTRQASTIATALLWVALMSSLMSTLAACAPDAGERAPAHGSDAARELARYAPALPPSWVVALTADDEATFEDFARQEGAGYLLLAETHLERQLDTSSREAFEESYAVLVPALARVRSVLNRDFGCATAWRMHKRFVELSMDDAFTCVRLFDEAYAIEGDETLGPAEKIAGIRPILDEMKRLDAPITTAHLLLRLSDFHGQLGDQEAQLRVLKECIATDSRVGDHRITCQALGVLGTLVEVQDGAESGFPYWNQGLALAIEHRLPEQSGRLTTFFANYYQDVGSLALARHLQREALELSVRFGGSPSDVRFLEDWLLLNARMGSWDVVERDLRRAELQLIRFAEWSQAEESRNRLARMDHIRALVLLQEGKREEANDILQHVDAELTELGNISTLSRIHVSWARALLEHDESARAQRVLDRALRMARDTSTRAELLVLAGAADAALDEWNDCELHLQAFEEIMGDDRGVMLAEWTLHDALRIHIAWARGDTEFTAAATKLACSNLDAALRSYDAIAESHLILREVQVLREVLHEIVAARPELGYELELEWRRVPRLLGTNARGSSSANEPRVAAPRSSASSPLMACAQLACAALRPAGHIEDDLSLRWQGRRSPGSVQLLYYARDDSLERWCVSENEFTHDTLALPEAELHERVGRILNEIGQLPFTAGNSGDDVEPLSPTTRAELHELARSLLPASFFEESRGDAAGTTETMNPGTPFELSIAPDGPLCALPFGILNLSAEAYAPLILRCDPAYLGSWSEAGTERSGDHGTATARFSADRSPALPGVIVADPIPAPGSRAWDEGLPRLEHGIREARQLHTWMPGSVLLEGSAATKPALKAAWEDTPLLYFASHVVRDKDAPYISYLPLSPSRSPMNDTAQDSDRHLGRISDTHLDALEDEYLEVLDVCAAEFREQPLVVLSACSSGAPYLVHGAQAPGLGEAFLSAGASAVIQTLWSVRDEVAASLMQNTMRAWVMDGVPPERALNAARRDMAREGSRTHPYFWGSAVVLVAQP